VSDVPDGDYTIRWEWPSALTGETYAACWDITVEGGGSGDCRAEEWLDDDGNCGTCEEAIPGCDICETRTGPGAGSDFLPQCDVCTPPLEPSPDGLYCMSDDPCDAIYA